MADTSLITVPSQGALTIIRFFEQMAKELKEVHYEILNELARAITERGWILPIDAVVQRIAENSSVSADKVTAGIAELARRRLVDLDETGQRFSGFLGGISFQPTPHRAHLETGVDVYTHGAMELLTVSATLLKRVDAFTRCPVTNKDIQLAIANDQITSSNLEGVAGYLAEWDGAAPLALVAANSPLLASDEALESWETKRPGARGMAFPSFLMPVAMQEAAKLGSLRFMLIGRRG